MDPLKAPATVLCNMTLQRRHSALMLCLSVKLLNQSGDETMSRRHRNTPQGSFTNLSDADSRADKLQLICHMHV